MAWVSHYFLESDHIVGLIKRNWPARHYVSSNTLFFVAPEGISVSGNIARSLGAYDEENEQLLLVVEVSSYSGFQAEALWEWLRKVRA